MAGLRSKILQTDEFYKKKLIFYLKVGGVIDSGTGFDPRISIAGQTYQVCHTWPIIKRHVIPAPAEILNIVLECQLLRIGESLGGGKGDEEEEEEEHSDDSQANVEDPQAKPRQLVS